MILKKCRAETLLIFLNVLLTIFFELNSIKNFQSYELSYSVADGLVSCLNVRIIGMCGILSAIVAEIVIFKNDFKINYAIRNKSRQKIFLKQVLRLFWFSFFSTLAVYAATILLYLFYSNFLIDWSYGSSVFYATIKHVSHADFLLVLVMTVFCYFVVLFSLLSVFLMLRWIFKNYLWGFLIFLMMIAYDSIVIEKDRLIFSATKLVSYYSSWNKPFMMIAEWLFFMTVLVMGVFFFSKSRFVNRGELC